jgi:hypothetical protein
VITRFVGARFSDRQTVPVLLDAQLFQRMEGKFRIFLAPTNSSAVVLGRSHPIGTSVPLGLVLSGLIFGSGPSGDYCDSGWRIF